MSAFESLVEQVRRRLATAGLDGRNVAVAFSGGIDSMVLLDALGALAPELGFRLSALHVNHGLSPQADAWTAFCEAECASRGIVLDIHRVVVDRHSGDGLEAAARQARYRCFRASGADVVVTAHHFDDQAETVLLQMLRGAGVEGMAAMPFRRPLGPGAPVLLRPLLEVARKQLLDAADERSLRWVTDESNADPVHARNFLRAGVLPLLETRFPAWRETLNRVARNAADASDLAATVAAEDLGRAVDGAGLRVDALIALAPVRRANLVRHWLRRHGIAMPARKRLDSVVDQLLQARPDGAPSVALGGITLRRHGGRLIVDASATVPEAWKACWTGEASLPLPDGRVLHFDDSVGAGIARARLEAGPPVEAGFRVGGERLQIAAGRPRRALKKLLQESGMPPWERSRLPLLRVGDEVAWVDGIGIDVEFAAGPGEPGVLPWVGHA